MNEALFVRESDTFSKIRARRYREEEEDNVISFSEGYCIRVNNTRTNWVLRTLYSSPTESNLNIIPVS